MRKKITFIILCFCVFALTNTSRDSIDVQAASNDEFITEFVDNGEQNLTDYEINETGTAIVSKFNLNPSSENKTITYVLPDGVKLVTLPEIKGDLIAVNSEVSSTTNETTVTLTYSADSEAINVSTSILINVDPGNFYSGQVFSITSKYECVETGEIASNTNNLTMHNYLADYNVNSKLLATFTPIITDEYMDFSMYNVYSGDYSYIRGTGYETYFSDGQFDLSKIQVDLNGTDDFKSIGELGLLDAVDVESSYDYDASTGILSFADYKITGDSKYVNFKIKFDSSTFNDASIIYVPGESFDTTIRENNFESFVEHEGVDSAEMTFSSGGANINAQLATGASINGVKPNEDNIEMFSFLVTNHGTDLTDVSFEINIPIGMTIDELKQNTSGELMSDIGVTDENGNYTHINAGETTTLTTPIVGPQTITIEFDTMDSLTRNWQRSPRYFASGLRFIGSVKADDGDIVSVSLEENVTATYDVGNGLETDTILNISEENRELNLNIEEEQRPAIAINEYAFLDANGDSLTHVDLGDHVSINSKVYIHPTYYYGTPYLKLDDPTFFVSIPKELQSSGDSFDLDDVVIMSEGVDYSYKIKSVTEIDPSNGSYPDGKLLRIDMQDYALTTTPTSIYVDTIVNESMQDNCIVDNTEGSIIVDTTDEEDYGNLAAGYGALRVEKITEEEGINEGTQIANRPSIKLPVIMSSSLGAKTFVDTDNSDAEDYKNVTIDSAEEDYPIYYIGNTGNYHLQMFNTYDYNSEHDFNNYVVFPDMSDYDVELDLDNMVIDSVGSEIYKIYYTTSDITDTSEWVDGKYGSVIWTESIPSGSEITAIKICFTEFEENSFTTIDIPYTTSYLTVEDSVNYQTVIGQSIYEIDESSSTTGPTAGMNIKKSDAPTITLNSISDGDGYAFDETSTIINDVFDYLVEDDFTDELVTYDSINGFSDASTDDMYSVEVIYTDTEGNTTTYNEYDFSNLTAFNVGNYQVTYITEQDADAQVTTKTIDFMVEREGPMIEGRDVTFRYSEVPDNVEDLLVAFKAYAESHDLSVLTDKIEVQDFGDFSFEDYDIKSYPIMLQVEDNTAGMMAYTEVMLHVISDEILLSAKDYSTDISEAPTSKELVKEVMQVEAIDSDSSDCTSKVYIDDYDGYDVDNPEVGVYNIKFDITYMDGTTASVTNVLTITDDSPVIPDIVDPDENDKDIIDTGITYSVSAIVIVLVIIVVIYFVRKKAK